MSVAVMFLVIAVNSVLTTSLFTPRPLPEDGRLHFPGLSEKYGHKAEEHSVVTEDGYILTLFRLPGKRTPPILLLHGLVDSADTFIIRGNTSMAITLANRGYDVWAGNARGNRYSQRHTYLNADTDPSFWDYSFHERGYYDLAAITDYILKTTGEPSLQSIAHSEGTTDHFVLGSLRPEYNEKFKIFIALAPVAFLSNLVVPVSTVTKFGPYMNEIFRALKIDGMFRDEGVVRNLEKFICNQGAISWYICVRGLIFPIAGYDLKRFEPDFAQIVIGHYPAADSRKSFIHYDQIALSKRFTLFDYGPEENFKRYGFVTSPEYNLTRVSMNTALIVGRNDAMSRVRDVETLRFLLPNLVEYHLMKPKSWNHLDFVWGNDMQKTLLPHVVSLLEKYT